MARPELLSQTTQKLRVFRIIGPGMKELLLLIRKLANLTTRLICLGRKVSKMQELLLKIQIWQMVHIVKNQHGLLKKTLILLDLLLQ